MIVICFVLLTIDAATETATTECVPSVSACSSKCQAEYGSDAHATATTCMCTALTTVREMSGPSGGELPIDIAFMIDGTASMETPIFVFKKNIANVAQNLGETVQQTTNMTVKLRVSISVYRDPFDSETLPNEVLPFTDINGTVEFVHNLRAHNGGDRNENVNGGILAVLHQKWEAPYRILVHMGDSKGHGLSGEDAAGLHYQDLIAQVNEKRLHWIAMLSFRTNPMIESFNEEYAVSNTGQIVDPADASIDVMNFHGLDKSQIANALTVTLVEKMCRYILERQISQPLGYFPICNEHSGGRWLLVSAVCIFAFLLLWVIVSCYKSRSNEEAKKGNNTPQP